MLELVYRIVSKTIAHTGLGVRVPSPVKFEKPLFMSGFLNFTGKKANCFAFVGTRRPEPYASFAEGKGEHGEAGSRAARVTESTCDRVPLHFLFFLWEVSQLLGSRGNEKAGAMFLFERSERQKSRGPGWRKIP